MSKKTNFTKIIENGAKKQRKRIGIGIIKEPSIKLYNSLKRAGKLMNIVVYGRPIKGFENIKISDAKKAAIQMVTDFKNGKIDQFVRGQVDDFYTADTYIKQFNINPKVKRIDIALLEDINGWQFFLTGGSNPDIQSLKEKIEVIKPVNDWIKNTFKIKLKVAVMATCRPGSYGKDPVMSKTYDEAESVVKYLRINKILAKNVHIEIEEAKKWGANLILPARGIVGNQIFRTLLYLGGGKCHTCSSIFPKHGIYEDNSRNEEDYYYHLLFAQFLTNNK